MRMCVVALLIALLPGTALQAGERPEPSPGYAPAEVVGEVLRALARPDRPEPDAGIATTFRFASPDNRRQTGPLERFVRLVKNPVYAPLLGHRRALRGQMTVEGTTARERVRVIGEDGSMAEFAFILGRQPADAECGGCWMTDAVIRLEPQGTST